MAVTEFIRLEVAGEPPKVLRRLDWSGPEPLRVEFLEYAKTALEGFYHPDSFEPKPGYGALRGGPPVPEAVRLAGDEGSERWRYTLYDLRNDRRLNFT